MSVDLLRALRPARVAWNKGRIIGQKRPLLPRHVWSIRVRLEMASNARDLALFNMAVDSKLRGCDLIALRVRDVFAAGCVKERASMIQSKTGKPVRFEVTETAHSSLACWVRDPEMIGLEFLWPSRIHGSPHLSTRQYARIVRGVGHVVGSRAGSLRHPFNGAQRWRKSTRRRATSGRCNCCWAIQKWTARSATSASTSRKP